MIPITELPCSATNAFLTVQRKIQKIGLHASNQRSRLFVFLEACCESPETHRVDFGQMIF